METPQHCDLFVVLPPLTQNGVIFGKNSGRPQGEVQEVVYFPASESPEPTLCTFLEVESTGTKKAIIVSKPGWMWGAEMGGNECGVAIGNIAIYTNDKDCDSDPAAKRLLGVDLVRLGLERSSSATEALDVITQLLDKYGQGGPCIQNNPELSCNNSFLIADPTVAWVLETCGKHWVAEEVTSGYRNISNLLTITTKIDRKSDGLLEYAKSKGFWNGTGEFNFCEAFSAEKRREAETFEIGKKLLENLTASNKFRESDMFAILRNKEGKICRARTHECPTQSSQVSVLSSSVPSVHWFTATPDPSQSVFKPFIFTKNVVVSKHTKCPELDNVPHTLYSLHAEASKHEDNQVQNLLRTMEADCVKELEAVMEYLDDDLSELDELLKDCVETEIKFYR